jgi:hypothetical protein
MKAKVAHWQWREGSVETAEDHFELFYGEPLSDTTKWVRVAVFGRPRDHSSYTGARAVLPLKGSGFMGRSARPVASRRERPLQDDPLRGSRLALMHPSVTCSGVSELNTHPQADRPHLRRPVGRRDVDAEPAHAADPLRRASPACAGR